MIFRTAIPHDPVIDTRTARFGRLLGCVKLFAVGRNTGWFEREWIALNGEDAVRRFCRAVRARAMIDGQIVPGIYRAWLNRLDPPACRCGRAGTRIIGSVTFCARCGPPVNAATRFAKRQRLFEEGTRAFDEQKRAEGKRDLGHEQFRRTKDRHR